MGLLSRLLLRGGGTPPEPPGAAGSTDVFTGLGALVSQAHAFQGSPLAAGDASRMMAEAQDLQREVTEIVARHGFDPSRPAAGADVGDAVAMQREIMEAMQRHGFPVPGAPPSSSAPPSGQGGGPIRDPLGG